MNNFFLFITLIPAIAVEQPDYHDLKQEVITLANTRYGRFGGDRYPLNALVEYARE
jgi:hypothetical protein